MLSVIIPTLNAEATLAKTLEALIPGAVAGLVGDVVVADGGSNDATRAIAEEAGCVWVSAVSGRGSQLVAGADVARGDWLLFLHADTVLEDGWISEVERFIQDSGSGGKAGVFRFALASHRRRARVIEWLARLRGRVFALPYGDQGLLISHMLFERIGGFRSLPIMEDVEIVRRIGRRRLVYLQSRAVTSATRYERGGYFRRALHNLTCLSLYFSGVPAEKIRRRYG